MLTKDLINAKVVKGQLRPQFLLAEDFVSKSLAEEVLCFLAECRGERYGDVLKRVSLSSVNETKSRVAYSMLR